MNLSRWHRTFNKLKKVSILRYSQAVQLEQDEYTATPEYPPIIDTSSKGRKLRERMATYDKIQNINTVEEKQIALNMPRYYGWNCVIFKEDSVPYNAMPFVQYYTRTHFKNIDKLPDYYTNSEKAASVVQEIKSYITEALSTETEGVEHNLKINPNIPEKQQKENALTTSIVRQINRIICNNLADNTSYILAAQVDYEPRHEAFWFVGGTKPPIKVVQWRKKNHKMKEESYEPINRPVQYIGTPILTLRSHQPLKPIFPFSEAENSEFKVPKYDYYPESVGYFTNHRHGTNIPGFWPGEYDEFGFISFHGRGHILDRKDSFGPEDNLEALHCQGIKASFGWLLAQANYQGFTTYNDLTYPFVTQTVITNGQLWSFYVYQLNTIGMHNDVADSNQKHNICFGTKPMKLFDTIENGVVKGLNEEVLNMLVQFYLNAPEKRDHEMKPYLGKEEQFVADIEEDKKRAWLENRYKLLVSNRPRHYLLPEVYQWEDIYKIKFNTRFFERRVRPFALGINPYRRRLDEHLPPYIPKVLRPYPRCRKKFEDTYYPKV